MERILAHRTVVVRKQSVDQYLVKWVGYDREEDNTWEPLSHFQADEHIAAAKQLAAATATSSGEALETLAPRRQQHTAPMSELEAMRLADEKGVVLVPSGINATGYRWVTCQGRHSNTFKATLDHNSRSGGKVHLGSFPSAPAAALAIALHLGAASFEVAAEAAAKMAEDEALPRSDEEVRRVAREEGLELIESEGNATGFLGVTQAKTGRRRFTAAGTDPHGKTISLGSFGSALEAALAFVRHQRARQGEREKAKALNKRLEQEAATRAAAQAEARELKRRAADAHAHAHAQAVAVAWAAAEVARAAARAAKAEREAQMQASREAARIEREAAKEAKTREEEEAREAKRVAKRAAREKEEMALQAARAEAKAAKAAEAEAQAKAKAESKAEAKAAKAAEAEAQAKAKAEAKAEAKAAERLRGLQEAARRREAEQEAASARRELRAVQMCLERVLKAVEEAAARAAREADAEAKRQAMRKAGRSAMEAPGEDAVTGADEEWQQPFRFAALAQEGEGVQKLGAFPRMVRPCTIRTRGTPLAVELRAPG